MKKNMEPRGISFFLSDAGGIFDWNYIHKYLFVFVFSLLVVDIIYTCVVVFVFRSFVCDDDDDDNGRFGEGGAGGRKKDFAIFRQSLRRATTGVVVRIYTYYACHHRNVPSR